MIGLSAGLTPQQQSENQANFRFGMQLGADQISKAVSAKNALAQVQAANQAEFQRQQAITEQLNQGRADVAKIKADETRAATQAKFTEDSQKYAGLGLSRAENYALKQDDEYIKNPEKWDDATLQSASVHSGKVLALTQKGLGIISKTPMGASADISSLDSEYADLIKSAPKGTIRPSYEDKTKSQTAKNLAWTPGSGRLKKGAFDIDATTANYLSAIDASDAANSDFAKAKDDLASNPTLRAAAMQAGKSGLETYQTHLYKTRNDAFDYAHALEQYYRSDSRDPVMGKLLRVLREKNLSPFSVDMGDRQKVGTFMSDLMRQDGSRKPLTDEQENKYDELSRIVTGKPLNFWRSVSGAKSQEDLDNEQRTRIQKDKENMGVGGAGRIQGLIDAQRRSSQN